MSNSEATEIDIPPSTEVDTSETADAHLDHVLYFQKWQFIHDRVIIGYGGPEIATLLDGIFFQGWTTLFLQDETQYKFGRTEVYAFYTNASAQGTLFIIFVHGTRISLVGEDIAHIFSIPLEGKFD